MRPNLCYKNTMKIKTLTSILLIAFLLFLPSSGKAQRMGIAAIVNNDIITYSDVAGRVQLGLKASNIKDTPETRQKLEAQALNNLIGEQLRLQEAKRLNISVPDKDIESAIDNIAHQNKVDPQKFREILKQSSGALSSLKQQIKSQISWTQVVRKRLRPQVNVTEADIDNFISDLNKHEGKSEYNLAEILLLVNNDDEDKEKLALANDLVKQLRGGASFPGIARQFSQGKEARNGGAIGWVLEGSLMPPLDEALKTMTKGALSDPIKTDFGYHILLLRDKRVVSTKAPKISKIHLKQVLIPISPSADEKEIALAHAKAKSLQAETTSCTAMDQLIAQQSNTMSKDVGLISTNQLPPIVLKTINGLPDEKMSEPLRAKEGFLVMMICGREESASDDQMRDQIANKIGAERLDRLQQRYVRDLRATAYIDIKN